MEGNENALRPVSSIPRPQTRSQTRAGTFSDITSAANNNATGRGLLPPGTVSKNYMEVQAAAKNERKTLAQRAGEVRKAPSNHGISRSLSVASRSTVRDSSSNSSFSSRAPSVASSRTTSRYGSSTGHGHRPTHSQSVRHPPRPQTSFGYASSDRVGSPRSKTSMGTRDNAEMAGSTLGKRKGTQQLSSQYNALFHPQKETHHGSDGNSTNNMSPQWSDTLIPRPQPQTQGAGNRVASINTQFKNLSLNRSAPVQPLVDNASNSPITSKLPVARTPLKPPTPSVSNPAFKTPVRPSPASSLPRSKKKKIRDSPSKITPFLTKDSNLKAWDQDEKLREMMDLYANLVQHMQGGASSGEKLTEAIDLYKTRVVELETKQAQLMDQNIELRVELEGVRHRFSVAENSLQDAARNHETAISDLEQRHRIESESIRQEARRHIDTIVAQHQEELRELRRRCESEIEEERKIRTQEVNRLNSQTAMDIQRGQIDLENKTRELRNLQRDLERIQAELEHERKVNKELKENLVTVNSNTVTLESSIRALKARIEFLESGNKEQSDAFARLDKELADALAETALAKDKLRKEETLRRKLHNQVQELKGNIRVFCRVRPMLPHEPPEGMATIAYPDQEADSKEIAVQGPEERSSLGTITTKTHAYSFDHVFGPSSKNLDVFEEISQLVQSALDGYNVCIFCYGQTGSGKTHTMSSEDGMITRAVHQIYETARSLEEKGWTYVMEGNFVEVYNENLNDLLGDANHFDKKKHEIRHDIQRCKTMITDITTVTLDSPSTVESILRRAATNRSVAATKANERSSRSHSVFILKLIGENTITGERSEGTLNLVDLAGSERLSQSGATGERLRETQNINRSLSCLGDVIGALGQGKEGGHIPYRNSKLTYLLQFSLGGNSKTLMFVNVSPRREHLSETLTSLKFATKVHNTHIGTARKQTRVH